MTKPFIQDLVNDMTLDEKLAQLTQLGPYYWGLDDTVDLTGPFKELNIEPQVIKKHRKRSERHWCTECH
ncbi:hypothetical protein ACFSQ7_11355 [Paenibacillus rhizoplanae]